MDYEPNILQREARSTEFSDDQSYLLVQKANRYCACVGQTEECCLPKIVLTYDFGSLLYTCLDRCVSPPQFPLSPSVPLNPPLSPSFSLFPPMSSSVPLSPPQSPLSSPQSTKSSLFPQSSSVPLNPSQSP